MPEKPRYMPSAIVNPCGYGMQFCLDAMNDCLAEGDTVMYDKWLNMGLKYAHTFLKADNAVWQWRCEERNYATTQNYMIAMNYTT